jgi:RNA polymerase sigma factor (sigma-70 family)
LLLRIRDAQDAAAWEVFDAIYRPLMKRYAVARGLKYSDAEDVVQRCMAEIHRRIGGFDYDPAKGRFKGWLRTMVANCVRNLLRGRREHQEAPGDFERAQQREESPDDTFERLWVREHLWYCLRQVREEVAESTFKAYQYHVIEQWPIEKVCRELNLKPNNVYTIKWRLTERVAEKMRELLGDEVEFG